MVMCFNPPGSPQEQLLESLEAEIHWNGLINTILR
jgi:hypothetical protein